MTSILTNTAAVNAVAILRTIDTSLTETQSRVSSGLRVRVAKDDAAYWSIATSMKSDNSALSSVSDALGLSKAVVDTQYSAMSSTIDVLAEFKNKLVAAKESSVDRPQIQTELDQLKTSLQAIAAGATFNGVSRLQTDIPGLAYASSVNQSLPASIIRSGSSFSVQNLNFDVAGLSLFNSDGGGILQKDQNSLGTIDGLRSNNGIGYGYLNQANYKFTGPITFAASDSISFDVLIDDGPYAAGIPGSVTLDKATVDAALGTTDGIINNRAQMVAVLNKAFSDAGLSSLVGAWTSSVPNQFELSSRETSGLPGSSLSLSNLNSTLPSGAAGGLENLLSSVENNYAALGFWETQSFRLKKDDMFSFDISIQGNPKTTITVTRSMVDAALGTDDGIVNPGHDMGVLMNYALSGLGIIGTDDGFATQLEIDPDVWHKAGMQSHFVISNIQDNVGSGPDFDIVDVDVTNPSADLDNYISGVEQMYQKAVRAGSALGSMGERLEMQSNFVANLQDSLSKGIGRLIDADMEKESAKLAAIQVQQQLSTVSLNIANQSPQILLALFRTAN
ncbi:hypothetical protein CKA34_02090 [Rhizobium sp. 11515TR]|nr:hypothetical protein CKA34_02090 [Rhizobium sp. 11515TR]